MKLILISVLALIAVACPRVYAHGDIVEHKHYITERIDPDYCDVKGISAAQVQHGYHTPKAQGFVAGATDKDFNCWALTASFAKLLRSGGSLVSGSVTIDGDTAVFGIGMGFNF